MINQIFQLVAPKVFSVKYEDLSFRDKVIIRPEYMAICHADQRYYLGQRDMETLHKKLPMALVHECCGRVVFDPSGTMKAGQKVVMVPNIPIEKNNIIYENYAKGSQFLSSGHDGFMRELVAIDADRVVPYDKIEPSVAAITEFISVAVHATTRFDAIAHEVRKKIGIWGDGSLAYVVANVVKERFPNCKIAVIGRDIRKLSQFSFVDDTYLSSEIPTDFCVDHAFECCGGEGSYYAIEDVIRYINPQGTLMLMGVSENKIAINTRMVLEKGITLVGCSRSGRKDFEFAVDLLQSPNLQKRLKCIIYEDQPVRSISDMHRVLTNDLSTPFKTVFRWEM